MARTMNDKDRATLREMNFSKIPQGQIRTILQNFGCETLRDLKVMIQQEPQDEQTKRYEQWGEFQ